MNNGQQLIDTQREINGTIEQMGDKCLQPNPKKSSYVLCSEPSMPYKPFFEPAIGETDIPNAKSLKYLGAIIDEKLNWGENAEYVRKKAKRGIGQITRLTRLNF